MDLAGRKERGKAYCPIVVGSGIVPLPEKKTVKNHKNGCIRMYETVTGFYQIAHNWLRFKAGSNSSPVSRTESLETQCFKASFFVLVHMIFALGMTVILPTILGGESYAEN